MTINYPGKTWKNLKTPFFGSEKTWKNFFLIFESQWTPCKTQINFQSRATYCQLSSETLKHPYWCKSILCIIFSNKKHNDRRLAQWLCVGLVRGRSGFDSPASPVLFNILFIFSSFFFELRAQIFYWLYFRVQPMYNSHEFFALCKKFEK